MPPHGMPPHGAPGGPLFPAAGGPPAPGGALFPAAAGAGAAPPAAAGAAAGTDGLVWTNEQCSQEERRASLPKYAAAAAKPAAAAAPQPGGPPAPAPVRAWLLRRRSCSACACHWGAEACRGSRLAAPLLCCLAGKGRSRMWRYAVPQELHDLYMTARGTFFD